MRATLTEDSAKIFSEPNEQTISVATLHKGDEFELGKIHKKKKSVWVEVILSPGLTGYISGDTKIFAIKEVQLLNNSVDMFDAPAEDANIVKTYSKKAIFTAVGIEKEEGKGWVRVRDDAGAEGYIRGDAKIRIYQPATKASGKKLMITGGIFIGMGVVIYIFSMFQAQAARDSSLIMVALVGLGLMQLIQGFLQYRRMSKTENNPK
ncbi:MAG: Uncharacterized protein FD147_308 [Chloroflexi bacterium]|nr:MAG: Uncharacterized protein FD147_308 [Chloroflexota bacterium]